MESHQRRALKLNIVKAALMVALSGSLLFGALTLAWYVRSPEAVSKLSTISADSSTADLRIAPAGAEQTAAGLSATITRQDVKLFPISTMDCVNWYYLNVDEPDINGEVDDDYALVDFTETGANAATGLYNNHQGEATPGDGTPTYAYLRADFVFMSTGGDLAEYDVFLNSANPITLTRSGAAPSATNQDYYYLDDAIRIAIVDTTYPQSPVLRFIYAPVAESGKGNSRSTTADAFWGVSGTNAVTQFNTANAPVLYTPATLAYSGCVENGTVPICHAGNGSTGHPFGSISVYIWLEGTDAQTKLGKTDNLSSISDGLTVNFNFVGLGA